MIKFTIDKPPFGKQRPRKGFSGNIYTPTETKKYEKYIAKLYPGDMLDNYVHIIVDSFYPIPKNTSKKKTALMEDKKILPVVKPDVDNVGKIVMDALNGLAYTDDKKVVELVVRKFYSVEPRVEVMIWENELF